MKKYFFAILAVIAFAGCKTKSPVGANGVVYTSALQYNDYIMDRQKKIVEDITTYTKATAISLDEAEKSLDKAVVTISSGLKDIQGMPPWKGDSALRDAAVDLFAFYKKSFSTDFKEMLAINRKVQSNTQTQADLDRFKEIQDGIGAKEGPLDAKMKQIQTDFATKNDLKLTDNSVQNEIDKLKDGK